MMPLRPLSLSARLQHVDIRLRANANAEEKSDLVLDHLTSGSVHTEFPPRAIDLPSWMSTAVAIFLIEHRQTSKQTDATEHSVPRRAAIQPAWDNDRTAADLGSDQIIRKHYITGHKPVIHTFNGVSSTNGWAAGKVLFL